MRNWETNGDRHILVVWGVWETALFGDRQRGMRVDDRRSHQKLFLDTATSELIFLTEFFLNAGRQGVPPRPRPTGNLPMLLQRRAFLRLPLVVSRLLREKTQETGFVVPLQSSRDRRHSSRRTGCGFLLSC